MQALLVQAVVYCHYCDMDDISISCNIDASLNLSKLLNVTFTQTRSELREVRNKGKTSPTIL